MKTLLTIPIVAISAMIFSCATTSPTPIFTPQPQNGVAYFYRDGRPFVATSIDSILVSFVLDYSVKLAGREYIRVWLLAQNNSRSDFLLDPWGSFKLIPLFDGRSIDTLFPISRTQIMSDIDNEQAITQIVQTIGSTLKALSTEPTTLTDSRGNKVQLNDRQEKLEQAARDSRVEMASTATLYAAFKTSVNAGIIRRNTLFPGEGIHGFIYFPKPIPAPYYEGLFDFTKYDLTMKISTSRGARLIKLSRTMGD
jgi:hypothetical protein